MATITPKLTIASTTVTGNETLGLSISKQINVDPAAYSGVSNVGAEISSGSAKTLLAASAGVKYLYVSHTGKKADGTTTASKAAKVLIDGDDHVRLNPGEFAFFPVTESKAVTVIGESSSAGETIMVEYAHWKYKSSS